MKPALPLCPLLVLVLAACGDPPPSEGDADGDPASVTGGELELGTAWARARAPGSIAAAVYLRIDNRTAEDERLVGGGTVIADSVELHIHVEGDEGMMRMEEVGEIAIPAGGSAVLGPGGAHLMLFGLGDDGLGEGESFPMTLRFAEAGEREVTVHVGSASASDPPVIDPGAE